MVSLATFLRWSGTQRLGGVIGMVGLQGLKIEIILRKFEHLFQKIIERVNLKLNTN